jgi:cation diffusion facilitator CzcD-associated flavoprotein CzcO
VTSKGIRTKEGEVDLDIIAMGTGFDAVSGGILAIQVRGTDGRLISEKWKNGVRTFLGLSSAGYPNMYMLYGPQSPSGWSNGPTTAELQGDMVVRIIDDMRRLGCKRIEAMVDAEDRWVEHNREVANLTLIPQTDSWYNGSNVPGKPIEVLNYGGGLPTYAVKFSESADNGYAGFRLN